MLFNSLAFLIFFPLFLCAYFSTRGAARLAVCLAASYVFYGWWDWRFLGLIALSTIVDYSVGLRLGVEHRQPTRKLLLAVSIVVNLGVLALFKYFNFFIDSLVSASAALGVGLTVPVLEVVLPVGISFYTFQTMSYTIDVYRRRIEVEQDLVRFATFVAFFPQLVAGPIVRAGQLLPQLREDHPFDADRFLSGLHLMVWGLFKKVVVADSLAAVVDARFAAPEAHGTLSLSIGVLFYAFQIYCDFSGYSDIAIGAARTMGFNLGLNFRTPYFSRGFSEFWQRWHISLSSWLRDYLYIPLGGNRLGGFATYRNLMIVMLLGGLWHGANWTFVVWGGLHGSYLILQRLVSPHYQRVSATLRLPVVMRDGLAMLVVFLLTCLAWIFFRAPSLTAAADLVARTFGLSALGVGGVPMAFDVVKGFALISILLAFEALGTRVTMQAVMLRPRVQLATATVAIWAIALLGTFGGTRFIYFQF